MKIYSILRKARIEAGMTQETLARRIGVAQPVVARLESGRSNPSLRTLERVARVFKLRVTVVST